MKMFRKTPHFQLNLGKNENSLYLCRMSQNLYIVAGCNGAGKK